MRAEWGRCNEESPSNSEAQHWWVRAAPRSTETFLVCRLRPLPRENYLSWPIVTLTAQSTPEALAIEARHRISFWDALILHAAEAAGATILYSEDFSSGQAYGAVYAVNPLVDR